MALLADDFEIRIKTSEDGSIIWIQLKSLSGRKIKPDQLLLELETYIYDVSQAYDERSQTEADDH